MGGIFQVSHLPSFLGMDKEIDLAILFTNLRVSRVIPKPAFECEYPHDGLDSHIAYVIRALGNFTYRWVPCRAASRLIVGKWNDNYTAGMSSVAGRYRER